MTTSYAPDVLKAAFDAAMLALPTDRQRRFVQELLADPDNNAKQAAIRAGYSRKTAEVQASQTLRQLKVRAALDAGRRLALWQVMDADELRARIALRSRASLSNVVRLPDRWGEQDIPDPAPLTRDDIEGLDDAQIKALVDERVEAHLARLAARGQWSIDLVKAQHTGGIHQIKRLKEGKYGTEVEMFDGLPAQELLSRILKLSGDGGILKYIDLGKLTTEQVQRIADGEDALAVLLTPPTESPGGA